MKQIVLKVDGMSCSHCVDAVTKAVGELGATDVSVSLQEKTVSLSFDDTKISIGAICDAIEDQGFDVVN